MRNVVQKDGDAFVLGEFTFIGDEVNLQSNMTLPCQKDWQGVVKVVITKGEKEEVKGLVCLGSDHNLKLKVNDEWWLIAENVESHTKALERTLGFFFD